MKTTVKRFFVGLLTWIGISILCLVGLIGYPVFYNVTHSVGIEDCGASVNAWLDKNGNGIKDQAEPPLAGACFWVNANYSETDSDLFQTPICKDSFDYSDDQGKWRSLLFGCYGDAIYVSAIPPIGYVSTTPPVVLSQNGDNQFGFAPASIKPMNEIHPLEYYAEQTHKAWLEDSRKSRAVFWVGIIFYLLVSIYLSVVVAKKVVKTV